MHTYSVSLFVLKVLIESRKLLINEKNDTLIKLKPTVDMSADERVIL